MSLVVPAEHVDAVQETDRVERILVVDDDVRLRTLRWFRTHCTLPVGRQHAQESFFRDQEDQKLT